MSRYRSVLSLFSMAVVATVFFGCQPIILLPVPTDSGQVALVNSDGPNGENTIMHTSTGVIEGVVQRSDTRTNMDGVTIELKDATVDAENENNIVATTTTDSDGVYRFEDVAPGRYFLTAVATFTRERDTPCGVGLMGMGWTHSNWLAVTGVQEGTGLFVMIAIGADNDEFAVTAGEVVTKNVDLACK